MTEAWGRRSHLDLFSGIGGFALAAAWAGYRTVGFCEIDPFCRRVLARHWPEVPAHDDIHTLGADLVSDWLRSASGQSRLDLLTGGFPCQPWSVAGARRGARDERHLWPEMRRVVAACRPRYVLAENVPGIINLALDDVCADLEAEGYAVWPVVVPAVAVGAAHRRDRLWLLASDVADAAGVGSGERAQPESVRAKHAAIGRGSSDQTADVADADRAGRGEHGRSESVRAKHAAAERGGRGATGAETEPGLGGAADGLPGRVVGAGLMDGRWGGDPFAAFGPAWEAGMTRTHDGGAHRGARLRALGNAIVPQVAYALLRSIPHD